MFAYLTLILLLGSTKVFALNDFQPYTLPNDNPQRYQDIKTVLIVDPFANGLVNIPMNLEQAMCGGWDFSRELNGVYQHAESTCPPPADEPIGARCEDANNGEWTKIEDNKWRSKTGGTKTNEQMKAAAKKTNQGEGLIAKVTGVPGRDAKQALGNIRSGLALRQNDGGEQNIEFSDNAGRRLASGEKTGFTYPTQGGACGLTTVCRTGQHPDRRSPPPGGLQNHALRDKPVFLCEHPCQRPLDDPGKPKGWDATKASSVKCANQQPVNPEDGVKYSCGGKQTQATGLCDELETNGQKGGLCQDMNNWTYILWKKPVHVCLSLNALGIPSTHIIYLYQKGACGFPAELDGSPSSQTLRAEGYSEVDVYECCSDTPFAGGKTYNTGGQGESCKVCTGKHCRLFPDTASVITNDAWYATNDKKTFPGDLAGGCLINWPVGVAGLVDVRKANPGLNVGNWDVIDPRLKRTDEEREYISFFREYPKASYERKAFGKMIPNDVNKKENVPVACYGFYDLSPEDALPEQTSITDKRCTIAAGYPQSSFKDMHRTQRGHGWFREAVADNPFNDPPRPFNPQTSLWYSGLSNAFSMLNDSVFDGRFHGDFSFALLTTDTAKQRITVQLDASRPLSSGALIRTPDDTITGEDDLSKERRTVVEWWHRIETEMHRNFTPPKVTLLLPTTWSIDLDPLDPLFTPPEVKPQNGPGKDIRSETIEVQVQAKEDLLGDLARLMERQLLLRIEEEPVPIVVPIINPTETRAIAQGWEAWATKQDRDGLNGADKAREVAKALRLYADQADNVRVLRNELANYAGSLLKEQKKVSKKTAEWLDKNIEAYQQYLFMDWGISFLRYAWGVTQDLYRHSAENDSFPWCKNERFTTPIYSLTDPWLPGRGEDGDLSGGFGPYIKCLEDPTPASCANLDMSIFKAYSDCLSFIETRRGIDGEEKWPTNDVCQQFFPLPPKMPKPPNIEHVPDLVLDFTAFKELKRSVKLPVLKTTQIRLDFSRITPPSLTQDKEPIYPELAPLPTFDARLAQFLNAALPKVVIPDSSFYRFEQPPILSIEGQQSAQGPTIQMPKIDLLSLLLFLIQAYRMIDFMTYEYDRFWESLVQKGVKPGTEQDCVKPGSDPKGKCIHFEADLKERFQRIGSRPAIFLKDDFRSLGAFRKPLVHGQMYCEVADWACQLLNAQRRLPREGWMLEITEEYNPEELLKNLRGTMRQGINTDILYDVDVRNLSETFEIKAPIELQ